MKALLRQLWHDERGSVGPEWAFVTTILVLGAITGALAARQGVLSHPQHEAPVTIRR